MYAMYVIGRVESNHNWQAVNMRDPITLGMMQWYGNRAYNLILKCKAADPDGWNNFKAADPALAGHVEANNVKWPAYYIDSTGAAAWRAWAARSANHQAQQNQWEEDFNGYQKVCDQQGYPAGLVKQRIMFMSAWHQGPKYALEAMRTVGPSASLEALKQAILNNRVLGHYKNRYNTVYDLLSKWDSVSAPPNFGQSGGATPAPDVPGGDPGEDSSAATPDRPRSLNISGHGNLIQGFDGDKQVMYYRQPGGNYVASTLEGQQDNNQTVDNHNNPTPPPAPPSGLEAKYNSILGWEERHAGKLRYSQGAGRLQSDRSGYGDCSSTVYQAYMTVGINVGTWTGQQCGRGTLIAAGNGSAGAAAAVSKAKPCDLLLLDWHSNGYTAAFDHVEMFKRNTQETWSHGGGMGPQTRHAVQQMGLARWQIRRYL